jgi:hypothetical protein
MSYSPFAGFQSTSNNSTTPLAGGATFTGTAEQNNVPDVMCSCYSDVAGTLYFDFSVDGTNWRTFPSSGFTVSAGIHEFHTAVKGPRYYRTRFINGGSAQATFQLYTYFGWFRQGTAPIGSSIADDADAIVVKSVISGVGNTTATVTDHRALQVTQPAEGKTAFGELLTAHLVPIIQETFIYNINPYKFAQRDNQSGSSAISSSMLVCQTGAAANSSGCVETLTRVKYEAGIGIRSRFTGLFTTGVANSSQLIGIGESGSGFYFGYNGTSFGVLRRNGGVPEIRTLTITTASSTTENVTVTLNGTAVSVAVTNSGVITTTANEIAAKDYSDVGRGWDATAVGSTVIFTSWDSSSRTGTYSVSGTTIVGSFAQTLAGVAPTDTWVAQADWNGDDNFDGTGLTGVTLDPTKGNVFQIDFQYLGFGAIRFYIEDPDDGELHLVHQIAYANANTVPSLENPSLPLRVIAENTSNTSNITIKSASMAAFSDGNRVNVGINRGIEHNATISSSGNTPITSWRVAEIYQGKMNKSTVKINIVACSVEHTKPVHFNFYANSTLVGASFSAIDSNSSIQQDTSATSRTGGVFLFSILLGKAGNQVVSLLDDLWTGLFNVGDTITVTAEYSSGTNAEVAVSFNVTEKI